MASKEKKGVTVKIDAELHAEVRRYIEKHEMTMGEFVSLALQDELHPRLNIKEDKDMSNMRTLAFQVPDELFQKIKDYLQRNNMTQKQFVIGLIENEIERNLTQHAAVSEAPTDFERVTAEYAETAAVSEFKGVSGDESEEPEYEELDDDEVESEEQGMSM